MFAECTPLRRGVEDQGLAGAHLRERAAAPARLWRHGSGTRRYRPCMCMCTCVCLCVCVCVYVCVRHYFCSGAVTACAPSSAGTQVMREWQGVRRGRGEGRQGGGACEACSGVNAVCVRVSHTRRDELMGSVSLERGVIGQRREPVAQLFAWCLACVNDAGATQW